MGVDDQYKPEESELHIMLVHDAFWQALADRDVDKRFSYCADFVTFIGSGLNEKAANREEYMAINKKGVDQYPQPFAMKLLWHRISLKADLAWVESEIEWTLTFEGREEKEMLRNTVVLRKITEKWLIVHVHGSIPDYRLAGQNYMTSADTSKRNIELEQQVYQRTKELNEALDHLKATQTQLIQSEKMASLGELTAGIAHEIQNPLNFVNNFSEVNKELLTEMTEEMERGNIDEAKAIASDIIANEEKITHHGKRADAIVKGMLQHSSTSGGVKEPTDINALCDEYLRLAYHGLRAKNKSFNAEMKTDFDDTIGLVNVIPQDIGRVILNLITNAFYAVSNMPPLPPDSSAPWPPEGGKIYVPTVSVSTRLLKSPRLLSGVEVSGDLGAKRVEISIADNGPGIPKSAMDKIFQPFFTTKPTGQGTGLGLSLSYDIVKAHGGELKVETKEGEGSVFTIQLPVN